MDHAAVDQAIETMRRDANGLVTSRSRVVDGLLDLRLLADGRDDVVADIDQVLGDIPGVTTADTTWWLDTLDRLADLMLDPRACAPALEPH